MTENLGRADLAGGIFARAAFAVFIASSTSLLIILAATWLEASQTGMIPTAESWRIYERTGNGPWDHDGALGAHVDFVFLAALITMASGTSALILARHPAHRLLAGFACAGAIVTMWYHLLLID